MYVTSELLVSIAGVLLSLAFSYIPGADTWFAGLDGVRKRLVMLLLILIVAGGIFGLSCWQLFAYVTCDQAGAWGLAQLVILAAIANQTTYLLSPRSQRVQRILLDRALNAVHGRG